MIDRTGWVGSDSYMDDKPQKTEEIAKASLPEINFRRWQKLMDDISKLEARRSQLTAEMSLLAKKSNELYGEMKALWENAK